jgi:hypothetical protein
MKELVKKNQKLAIRVIHNAASKYNLRNILSLMYYLLPSIVHGLKTLLEEGREL